MFSKRRAEQGTAALGLMLVLATAQPSGQHTASGGSIADAAMRRDIAAVRTLLQQRGDVNGAQGDGMTALHWAAAAGDETLAALLLEAGASAAAKTRIGHHTPLHLAAKGGHHAVVRLIVAAGADVRATTTTGAAPLHFAAASGSADTVAFLLDRGGAVNEREPQWGQTP